VGGGGGRGGNLPFGRFPHKDERELRKEEIKGLLSLGTSWWQKWFYTEKLIE